MTDTEKEQILTAYLKAADPLLDPSPSWMIKPWTSARP
jgi:hypothetical protein